jgi:hypothetical protein
MARTPEKKKQNTGCVLLALAVVGVAIYSVSAHAFSPTTSALQSPP